MTNGALARLDDATLTKELLRLAWREREGTVQLIFHLAEFDARRLYLGAGFSSLFAYCREILRLSEHESYNRIEAARASRTHPEILSLLVDGAVNLTTVRLLAPHLTRENFAELFEESKGRSKREVEEVIARRFPRPDVATTIRREPKNLAPRSSLAGATRSESATEAPTEPGALGHGAAVRPTLEAVSVAGATPASPRPTESQGEKRGELVPWGPDRYLIRFTASATTREKLARARDLLAHAVPSGDLAEVIDRGLDLLIDKLLREKAGLTGADQRQGPRRSLRPGSRHIPARVRREVWIRDGGRCAFVSLAGRRCAATSRLEFHHRRPYGIGGEATVENIELRCRAHNAYEATLFCGPARALDPESRSANMSG